MADNIDPKNFAKAFDVKFANQEGKQEYVWGTS
jgi:prolyl-tRNA synthetase